MLICSNLPIKEVEEIRLDSDSRTSAMLTRILVSKYWKISPDFVEENIEEDNIDSNNTYLLIGDKALRQSNHFKFVYDLAQEWHSFTGKPFVFAAWVANKDLPNNFISEFNEALAKGVSDIDAAIEDSQIDGYVKGFSKASASCYLQNKISYNLNNEKREGLAVFLEMASEESNFRVSS